MKIDELIAGKNDDQNVQIAGVSLPISALKRFMADGYTHLKPYQTEKAFSLWGKACTGVLPRVRWSTGRNQDISTVFGIEHVCRNEFHFIAEIPPGPCQGVFQLF